MGRQNSRGVPPTCGCSRQLHNLHRLTGWEANRVLLLLHQLFDKRSAVRRCLYARMQTEGVRCWFAPEDFKIGDKFRDRIDDSIRLHDKLLIVLSEESIA